MIFYGIKWQLKQPKLVHLDKVLYLTAMCSEGKHMTGHKIIGKANSFSDKLKITHKNTLCEKVTKDYLQELRSEYVLSHNTGYLILKHLSGPVDAR